MSEILIADDELLVAQATAELLEAGGHSVATVQDSRSILEALRRERPRLLLQDVRMPGLDLDAHLRSIRSDPETARTVVVLFTATMSLHELARLMGCDDVIEKPYVPEDLLRRVDDWLQWGERRGQAMK